MRLVVFLSHTASRTGAPLILLHLLRAARTRFDCRLVLGEDGPLGSSFRAAVPTLVLPAHHDDGPDARPRKTLLAWLDRASLVYANSAFSHDLLKGVSLKCPLLSHVHELEMGLANRTVRVPCAGEQRFIAVSEAVRSNLIHQHAISPQAVTVSYGFAPPASGEPGPGVESLALAGTGRRPHIVGSIGTLWPYKGPDLFVALCQQVLADLGADPATPRFVWVGGAHEGPEWQKLSALIRDAGISGSIRLIPEVADVRPFLRQFDVFVSTAREDPFPLVVLEAAREGKPIVTFDSGGAVEFVGSTAGVVVHRYDIPQMSRQVTALLRDPGRRARYGAVAMARVRSRFGAEAGVARLVQLIDDLM
ncbi:glycosyltransferase family 4 protein [Nonomuraea sp. NPDC048901]|uniref:glycosyltransferase family 4 protein n=1 Tax=Nonomuraea sp. NPDC048901 TaxID=3155627 RepID=UPI0033D9330A